MEPAQDPLEAKYVFKTKVIQIGLNTEGKKFFKLENIQDRFIADHDVVPGDLMLITIVKIGTEQ